MESSESVALPGRDAGFLQLRVVPDDNSCLFSSFGVVFEGGVEAAQKLRRGGCAACPNASGGGCDRGRPRYIFGRDAGVGL